MKLQILHTNDIHSHFTNVTKLSTLVQSLRTPSSLFIDAGDMMDRKNIIISGTKGIGGVSIAKAMGYDVLCIGNNEGFSKDIQTMIEKSTVPFLCCNLTQLDDTPIPHLLPYLYKTIGTLRILLIGNTVSGEASYNTFFAMSGFKATNHYTAIQNIITQEKENYDICIVVSHAGLPADEKLAQEVSGIHVIIGGHTHHLLEECICVNNTYIHQSGKYGTHLGNVELTIDEETKQIRSCEAQSIPIDSFESDPQLVALLDQLKIEATDALSVPLFTLSSPLWHDVITENPLTNLLADGLYAMCKADFAIINSGVLNCGMLDVVSELKLIACAPSPLNPTTFTIKGRFIKEAIIQSLDYDHCLTNGMGAGFRGYYIGNLQVSHNVRVLIKAKQVQIIMNDIELLDDAYYRVASSDYLQRGSGYKMLADNTDPTFEDCEIKDVLRTYLAKPEFVSRALSKRIIDK